MNTASFRRPDSRWQSIAEKLRSIFATAWTTLTSVAAGLVAEKSRSGLNGNIDVSQALDIDAIANQMSVEERARADGKNEMPPSSDEVVAGTQKEITVYFKQLQRTAQRAAVALADRLRELRDNIDLVESTGQLNDIPPRLENEIHRRTTEFESRIDALRARRQHYEELRDDLESKRRARHTRLPVFRYSLISVLIVTGAIAFIDAVAPETVGPTIVSVSWATLISLGYVLVPMLLGAAVSRSADRMRPTRIAGVSLGGGVAVAFITALALAAGYFVAAPTGFADVAAESVTRMLVSATTVMDTDVVAWAACTIVAAAGILAFLAGFSSASSEQSERSLQRALLRTSDERELRARQMRRRINNIVDNGQAEVNDLLESLRANLREYSQLVDEAKRIPDSLREHDIVLEDACNILLDRYRAANAGVRQTELPISFSEHVCFRTELGELSSRFTDEEEHLTNLQERVTDLEGAVATVRQQLRDMNRGAISDATPGARPVTVAAAGATAEPKSILPPSETSGGSSVRSIGDHASRRHGTM